MSRIDKYVYINRVWFTKQTSNHKSIPDTFAPKVLNPDFAHRLLQMDRTHISLTLLLGR